jgi:hypothetical protein
MIALEHPIILPCAWEVDSSTSLCQDFVQFWLALEWLDM